MDEWVKRCVSEIAKIKTFSVQNMTEIRIATFVKETIIRIVYTRLRQSDNVRFYHTAQQFGFKAHKQKLLHSRICLDPLQKG